MSKARVVFGDTVKAVCGIRITSHDCTRPEMCGEISGNTVGFGM